MLLHGRREDAVTLLAFSSASLNPAVGSGDYQLSRQGAVSEFTVMAMRENVPVDMLAVENHAKVSDVLVMCAFGVIGFAAGLGAVFAADLATALVQVLG